MSSQASSSPPPDNQGLGQTPQSYSIESPDPWAEIKKLRPGSDRSFAQALEERLLRCPEEQHEKNEERLLALLQSSNLDAWVLSFVCRQLAAFSSNKSLPVLAPLLEQASAHEAARSALEFIPDTAVDTLFWETLPKLQEPQKLGLLASLIRRASPELSSRLQRLLQEPSSSAELKAMAQRKLKNLSATTP